MCFEVFEVVLHRKLRIEIQHAVGWQVKREVGLAAGFELFLHLIVDATFKARLHEDVNEHFLTPVAAALRTGEHLVESLGLLRQAGDGCVDIAKLF